ncbi:unnamed protein product [Mytilus coruscus]|uniref:CCHC-type domain-containing protein n=1 Tax=Mytilus coruscus TaxID=42192 RepID=A0A6J8DZ16_MYTCO|nr:unnamed protein product [Mytilus coruscus]
MAEQDLGLAFNNLAFQLQGLSNKLGAQGVNQIIPKFSGDASKFRTWIKQIEKYIVLAGLGRNEAKLVAYQASDPPVSDFIHRWLEQNDGDENMGWNELKAQLVVRFSEVSDPQHAFELLKTIGKLFYKWPFFRLPENENHEVKLRHLSRRCCQNLRKRFELRRGTPERSSNRHFEGQGASEEAMEVDHYRNAKRCFNCNKIGHRSRDCRARKQVNSFDQTPKFNKEIECWKCGRKGKLRNSLCYEADKERETKPETNEIFTINLAGNPNSCISNVKNRKLRALVDSGAPCSLLHYKIDKTLNNLPKLSKKKVNLQSVNGNSLNCLGSIEIDFSIKNKKMTHLFYVVSDMNINVILGRDWSIKNGVRLYFDLGMLRVGDVYANLEEDIHISSILRLSKETVFKPQTSNICFVKIKKDFQLSKSKSYETSAVTEGTFCEEPGLLIGNSVVKINHLNRIPIHVVNSTNKTFKFKRGTAVGRINSVLEENLVSLEETKSNTIELENECEINVPREHKSIIEKLISKNKDIFATKDSELGHTDTVKMEIETENHPPIKLKPYRTPLHKRQIVDQAIDEMLDAGVIRKSKSAWSAPIVVVKKKDNTHRFCTDFRQIKNITKSLSYPLPLIDDILAQLGNAKRFIPNFSKISVPLVELTKKYAKFKWSDECQAAFEFLKESLSVIPLLAYPDLSKPYTLYTDASDESIGACLTQPCDENEEVLYGVKNEKPIYFLSHKLSDTQKRWSTIEKEAYTIHYALQKLDHYLHNAEFTIKTDHKPLQYLLSSNFSNFQ